MNPTIHHAPDPARKAAILELARTINAQRTIKNVSTETKLEASTKTAISQ